MRLVAFAPGKPASGWSRPLPGTEKSSVSRIPQTTFSLPQCDRESSRPPAPGPIRRDRGDSRLRDADLLELTVARAAAALRERVCSCREYVEALIARCEAAAHLNAFVSHDWEALLAAARAVDRGPGSDGPLAGVPLAFKDNIDTTNLTTSGATGSLRDFLAPRNAAGRESALRCRGTARSQGEHARARLRHHEQQRGHRCLPQPLGPIHDPRRIERRHRGGGRGAHDAGRGRDRHRRLRSPAGGVVRPRRLSPERRPLSRGRDHPHLPHARHGRPAGAGTLAISGCSMR